MPLRLTAALLCGMLMTSFAAVAHVGGHPSIHNVLADVIERLRDSKTPDELRRMRVDDVMPYLSESDRHVLGTEFVSFTVDQPVTVYVMRHEGQREVPFWLEAEDFEKTDITMTVDGQTFEGWKKSFPAGRVGLGVSGFGPHPLPYFTVLIGEEGAKIKVDEIYPGRHRDISVREGGFVYTDETEPRIEALPEAWDGATLITGVEERIEDTQLVNIFRETPYPATADPSHIVLTWSDDPKGTQAIQWRTSPEVSDGVVQYQATKPGFQERIREVEASMHVLEDRYLANDPINHRYTAVLRGLKPGLTYKYRVGSPKQDRWSDWANFTTAPGEVEPFTFVYMGDAQNGLDTWGELVRKAHSKHPEAAFYVMAGDLVNRGNERDDWDSFFENATGVYNYKQLMPAIGNHEDQGPGPWMYLSNFDLPENGPEDLPAERAYTVEYSNAIFIVLDSNLPPHQQAEWLEEQLANTEATWKFVVYHHPAYSSSPNRNNPMVRQHWSTLFDKYHVDLALQGHDHAYLRTYPMKGEEPQDSPAEGTIYIVSVSGTKMYDQGDFDYTEVGFTNVSTYQVLDITIDGDKLTYKAYDAEGTVRDEFVIEK